ncbi:MAG: DUF1573 domain-containing protein [Chthonomonas sp.]|nr:DUF1573 domain-containing protein [Chthonomonas sp.]
MTAALLAASLIAAPPGPAINPGTNEWFQRGMVSVMRDLEAGKFPQAVAKAARLPDASISMKWDETGLSAVQKTEFRAARDRAVEAWRVVIPELKVSFQGFNVPEVNVSFATTLPPNPDSAGPAGAVFLTSIEPSDPAIDAVIALQRGPTKARSVGMDVYNEVAYAIGSALGLARFPQTGAAMYRTEGSYNDHYPPLRGYLTLINENFKSVQTLRTAAAKKQRLSPAIPELAIQPARFDAKPTIQGAPLSFSITLTNKGKAPLQYRIVPDCGCFTIRQGTVVPPGETTGIGVAINTMDFPGKHAKVIYIYSNDPENPVRIFPVTFEAKPRYRFLWEEATDVLQVSDSGRTATVYLALEGDTKVLGASITGGATGMVDFEPWQGTLPDSKYSEGPMARKGYRFDLIFGPNIGAGRRTVGLMVDTDDPVFNQLTFPFYLQKGIVALPQRVYLGEVRVGQAAQASTRISRPGKPFKVLRVEPVSTALSATFEPFGTKGEYRINITFKGVTDTGNYTGKIRVHTDDPEQPVIEVDVAAVVR